MEEIHLPCQVIVVINEEPAGGINEEAIGSMNESDIDSDHSSKKFVFYFIFYFLSRTIN